MKKVATQLSPRVLANRRNGAKGGKARAENHSKAMIAAWSSKGGTKTLMLYGAGFFKHAQSKRKTLGQYKTPRKQKIKV